MNRLIVAVDRKLGMAKKGVMPWYIPEDERFFTQQTKLYGGECLIGALTFQTFQGPLVDRHNYVLTRDKTPIEGVELVDNLDKFLKDFEDKDLWVIGGANVFAQVIEKDKADELLVTHIEADFGCTQFFPAFEDKFTLVEQSDLKEENGFIFRFARYTRYTRTPK